MRYTITALALSLFLPLSVSAANIESVFLPKDLNQCLISLPMDLSIHTERIRQDQEMLGGRVYVNPYRNVETMIYMNNLGNYGCAQRVLEFARNANQFYIDYGVFAVFGSKKGTEALNRLGHFTRQSQFFYGGL